MHKLEIDHENIETHNNIQHCGFFFLANYFSNSPHIVVQLDPGVLGEGGDGLAKLLQVSPAP